MKIQKIGIITSGGDCGWLNAVVKGTSQMATQKKIQTLYVLFVCFVFVFYFEMLICLYVSYYYAWALFFSTTEFCPGGA